MSYSPAEDTTEGRRHRHQAGALASAQRQSGPGVAEVGDDRPGDLGVRRPEERESRGCGSESVAGT